MSRIFCAIAGFLMAVACGYAFAQSASFGLTLRVLPEDVAPAPADLPLPPNAQMLPPSRNAKRLLYFGSPGDAQRFYEDVLPKLGFSLSQRKSDRAVWEHESVRAELLFYPVVGAQDTTGIIVTMLLGIVWLGEPFSWLRVAGCTLIVLGVSLLALDTGA